MERNSLLQYISDKVNQGYNLSQISTQDEKECSYYSNLLKRLGLKLSELETRKLKENNKKFKSVKNTKIINTILLKSLIEQGMSSVQIAKKFYVSSPTVLKHTKNYLFELYQKIKDNGVRRQSQSMLGKINPQWKARKGKTYEEIYGPEKAIEMRAKRSHWLKNNNIRRFATRVSKPQAMLFEIVKDYFPSAILEYDVKLPNSRIVWLDIAIPEKKICIEYDGIYWHKINQNNTRVAVKDEERDCLLKSMGWIVYRIQSEENPPKEKLIKMFLDLNCINE